MSPQERIIRNALEAADAHGVQMGEGGKALARIYKERPHLDDETLAIMVALMANGLADLNERNA